MSEGGYLIALALIALGLFAGGVALGYFLAPDWEDEVHPRDEGDLL